MRRRAATDPTPADRRADTSLGATVAVHDLQKSYGLDTGQQIVAADHLSLTVQPGSVVAVTGPSGSGKSTLLPALTALDNVLAPVLPYRTPYDKHERARELLAAVGLQGRESSLPSRLSGGQQQRIAIARALINTPQLLLADEPTGNLDSTTGADILRLLLDLRDTVGMTVLLATHDPAIAAHADRLLRMRDGALVDDIDLTGEPADPRRLTGLG